MDMSFRTWNVRSQYRAGSLKTVRTELAKFNLDVLAVQEVKWNEGGVSQKTIVCFASEMGMLIST
jgi:exonuclease III